MICFERHTDIVVWHLCCWWHPTSSTTEKVRKKNTLISYSVPILVGYAGKGGGGEGGGGRLVSVIPYIPGKGVTSAAAHQFGQFLLIDSIDFVVWYVVAVVFSQGATIVARIAAVTTILCGRRIFGGKR